MFYTYDSDFYIQSKPKKNKNKTKPDMTLDEHISNIKHLIWLCCNNVSHNELVDYVNNYSIQYILLWMISM